MIFRNATSFCGPFRAAAVGAIAGGSQHSNMSARSHRIAPSLSVLPSIPLSHLDREGLATAMIAERLKNGGKTIEVVRFRITAARRRALES
jgi:hypothetical protein